MACKISSFVFCIISIAFALVEDLRDDPDAVEPFGLLGRSFESDIGTKSKVILICSQCLIRKIVQAAQMAQQQLDHHEDPRQVQKQSK